MCSVLLTWVSQKQLLPLVLMQCRWRKQLSIAAMAGDDWRHPVGRCWRRTAGAAPIISSSRGFGDSLMRAAEQPVHVSRGNMDPAGCGSSTIVHAQINTEADVCIHGGRTCLCVFRCFEDSLLFTQTHRITAGRCASRCACLFGDPRREECAQCGAYTCTWAQKSRSVCQSLSHMYRRTSTDTTKRKKWRPKKKDD